MADLVTVPSVRFADTPGVPDGSGELLLRLDRLREAVSRMADAVNDNTFGPEYRVAQGVYVSVGSVVNIQGQTARLADESERYLAGFGVVTKIVGGRVRVKHHGIVDVLTDGDDWDPGEDFSLAIGKAGVASLIASAPSVVATPSATRYRTIIGYPIARVRANLYRSLFHPVGTRVLVPVE